MYPVSFPCGLLHDIYRKKVVSTYGASPYCLFSGCIVTWAWSLAKGQYMVSWLLTGAPEQRYWQNRETANVGLDSSVGRAPARQSGGRRFKSRSSQVFFVYPNLSKNVPSQFPLWLITWNIMYSPDSESRGLHTIKLTIIWKYLILSVCNDVRNWQSSMYVQHAIVRHLFNATGNYALYLCMVKGKSLWVPVVSGSEKNPSAWWRVIVSLLFWKGAARLGSLAGWLRTWAVKSFI